MRLKTLIIPLLICLALTGCSSTNRYSRTDRAIMGGALGVGVGAATTNKVGGALAGGAIGAAIGAASY